MSDERITWAGHATALIEMGGQRLLTDPLVRGRIAHITRRVAAPDPTLLSGLDAVLLSHAHRDHMDVPSLRSLELDGPVLVPRGGGRVLRRALRDADVHELEAGDELTVGGVRVLATAAEHDGRRVPVGSAVPALGFVVEGTSRLYFAGDTDLFGGMGELGEIDLALLPVWGWGRRLPPGHLNPATAARAAALIAPRTVVPIHWGTYASPRAWPADPAGPAREFERMVAREAPEVRVRVLQPGEEMSLG